MSKYTGPLWECDEPINSTILQIIVRSSSKLNFHQGYFIYFSIWWYYSSVTLWATEFWFIPGSFSFLLKDNSWGCCCPKVEADIYILGLPVVCTFIVCPPLIFFFFHPEPFPFFFLLLLLFLSSFPFSSFSLPSSFHFNTSYWGWEKPRLLKEAAGRECAIPSSNLHDSGKDTSSQYKIVFPSPTEMKSIDAVCSNLLEGMKKKCPCADNDPKSYA